MDINFAIHPIKIEFFDWYLIDIPEIKHTVFIDTIHCSIIAKKHITSTHMVNIQEYQLVEEDMKKVIDIANIDRLREYFTMSGISKTINGYRDGWRTYYRVIFKNNQSFSGKLGDIIEESPLEQIITLLRERYPYIEVLKKI